MRATLKLADVDEVEAEITLRMSMEDWRRLVGQLETGYPSLPLRNAIARLIAKADARFTEEEEYKP